MEVRSAAKGIISTPDGQIIVVRGKKSGRWNLIGGGIKDNETPRQAFFREADEEIIDFSKHITDPVEEPGVISGEVTLANGFRRLAHWTIFQAKLIKDPTKLEIANHDEISAIAVMSTDECFNNALMSDLAKKAIHHTLNPDYCSTR